MGLKQWWQARRNRPKRAQNEQPGATTQKADLREFVYLDEVSLRSLLSSITGDLRDSASEQTSNEFQAELASALKAGGALTGVEGQMSSRFQTTNNSTTQTSRKATVQSWFKQFHEIPGLRLIEVTHGAGPAVDQAALRSTTDTSLLIESSRLTRGELVEFRVRLSADPVYQLGATATELTGMADDHPEMFESGGALAALRGVQPVGKVLDRLLVGLIPIRAVAIDYSLIVLDGIRYVAHNDLLKELDIPTEPLQVVGVTEQTGYWKDLRRVLFSESEVTVLGRIARSEIRSAWTPVKLADLFRGTAPDLVAQLDKASRAGLAAPAAAQTNSNDARLAEALTLYAASILGDDGRDLSEGERADLNSAIEELRTRSGSASDQLSAFKFVRDWLTARTGAVVDAETELMMRQEARTTSGLSLFPALASKVATPVPPTGVENTDNLLDVEVIAIYW